MVYTTLGGRIKRAVHCQIVLDIERVEVQIVSLCLRSDARPGANGHAPRHGSIHVAAQCQIHAPACLNAAGLNGEGLGFNGQAPAAGEADGIAPDAEIARRIHIGSGGHILQATGITNVIAALKHDVQRPDITAVEKDVIVFEYAGQLLGRDLCISVDRAVSQRQRLCVSVILEAAGRIVSAAYRALCDVENGAAEGNRAIRRPRTDAIGRPHCGRAYFGGNGITAKFIIRWRGCSLVLRGGVRVGVFGGHRRIFVLRRGIRIFALGGCVRLLLTRLLLIRAARGGDRVFFRGRRAAGFVRKLRSAAVFGLRVLCAADGTVRVHDPFRAGCFADARGNIFSPFLVIRKRCCGDQGQAQSKRGKQAKKSSFHCDPSTIKEFGFSKGISPRQNLLFRQSFKALFRLLDGLLDDAQSHCVKVHPQDGRRDCRPLLLWYVIELQ